MKKLIYFTIAILSLSFTGCKIESDHTSNSGPDRQSLPTPANSNQGTAVTDAATNTNPNTAPAARNFWVQAALGDLAEIELSKLAVQKAENSEVKRFAETMVSDHTMSSNEMKSIAQKANIQLPTELDPMHQGKLQQLQIAAGRGFDSVYVEAMVSDHEAAVQLFESQVSDNSDQDAKAFASDALPTLRKHLEMIKQIQTNLGRAAQGNTSR